MKKSLIVLLSIGAFYLSACKDNSTEDPKPEPTRRELLVNGHWQMTAGTIVPPIQIDIFGQIITISDFMELNGAEACDRDDFIVLNDNGTVTNDEGLTKCDPNDPQTSSGGSWSLYDNNNKLRLIDTGDTTDLTIQELTATSLKGTSTFENEGDTTTTTHTITFTFKNIK